MLGVYFSQNIGKIIINLSRYLGYFFFEQKYAKSESRKRSSRLILTLANYESKAVISQWLERIWDIFEVCKLSSLLTFPSLYSANMDWETVHRFGIFAFNFSYYGWVVVAAAEMFLVLLLWIPRWGRSLRGNVDWTSSRKLSCTLIT